MFKVYFGRIKKDSSGNRYYTKQSGVFKIFSTLSDLALFIIKSNNSLFIESNNLSMKQKNMLIKKIFSLECKK